MCPSWCRQHVAGMFSSCSDTRTLLPTAAGCGMMNVWYFQQDKTIKRLSAPTQITSAIIGCSGWGLFFPQIRDCSVMLPHYTHLNLASPRHCIENRDMSVGVFTLHFSKWRIIILVSFLHFEALSLQQQSSVRPQMTWRKDEGEARTLRHRPPDNRRQWFLNEFYFQLLQPVLKAINCALNFLGSLFFLMSNVR